MVCDKLALKKATKFVAGVRKLSCEARLRLLNLLSLYHRRRRGDMMTVYQVLNGTVDVGVSQFFSAVITSHNREHLWKLFKSRAVSEFDGTSFTIGITGGSRGASGANAPQHPTFVKSCRLSRIERKLSTFMRTSLFEFHENA